MSKAGKIWTFLRSMKFAILLLAVLAAACGFGSFITQGQNYEWYAAAYSERIAAAIMLFSLDDVFHSVWFAAITLFLCINLLLCNVTRFPSVRKRFRNASDSGEGLKHRQAAVGTIKAEGPDGPRQVFDRMHFSGVQSGTDPAYGEWMYAAGNRAGYWGAWICHVGILVLIAGFGLGQMMKTEYTVYGVPGQTKPVGDTGYLLTIDSFDVALREDDTVEQYTAGITLRDTAGKVEESSQISVNHPARMQGMKFYQNSTGWAADITVEKDGEEIQRETVCAGDYLEVKDKDGLIIQFSAFYPDYYMDPERGPVSVSSGLHNPGYLYRAYYRDQVIGMNVLTGEDVITIDEYTVIFSDPQSYTLIQVRRDPFTALALAGGLLVLAGLFLSFYLQPRTMWALKKDSGEWEIGGSSRKGGVLFEAQLKEAVEACGGVLNRL